MNEIKLQNRIKTPLQVRNAMLFGFLLRLMVLILIVYVLSGVWDVFYIEDDKKYEELAATYAYNAHGILDLDLFNDLTKGYAEYFWPFVICFTTKLTGIEYMGRFINIVLSTLCIPVVYKLAYAVGRQEKSAVMAARLFAYLPLPILVACFPIKDIIIMLGALYVFYVYVLIQSSMRVTVPQIVLCIVALLAVYYTRDAVTVLMLLFLVVYFLQKLYKERKYFAAVMLLIGSIALIVSFSSSLFSIFQNKVDVYGGYGAEDAVGLNVIRVTGLADIYKLPLAYGFAMLQPMKMSLFELGDDVRPWRTVIGYSNITMYPVAVGSFLYLFCKKHNLFFWLSSFVMFASVIVLSLGVSRHYLFMLPITIINYSLYMSENKSRRRTLVILGTFALFALVCLYSLVTLL